MNLCTLWMLWLAHIMEAKLLMGAQDGGQGGVVTVP